MAKATFYLFQNHSTFKHLKFIFYLNRFRGKPAITIFDKPFTPNYNSSQNIATFMSSVFQKKIFQPDHN